MNDNKLKKLFAAARRSPTPPPPADFADDVLRAARQTPRRRHEYGYNLGVFEQLNAWFPRLALASLAVIALCAFVEIKYDSANTNTADDELQQPANDFYNIDA